MNIERDPFKAGDIVETPSGKQYVVIEAESGGEVSVKPYTPYVAPPPNRHQRRVVAARTRRAS